MIPHFTTTDSIVLLGLLIYIPIGLSSLPIAAFRLYRFYKIRTKKNLVWSIVFIVLGSPVLLYALFQR